MSLRLISYIIKSRKKGATDNLIRKKILSKGYPPDYINNIFKFIRCIQIVKWLFIILIIGSLSYSGSKFLTVKFGFWNQQCGMITNDRYECYDATAHILGTNSNGDIRKAIKLCKQAPREFVSICFGGLAHGIGENAEQDIRDSINYFNLIPIKSRENFLFVLGFSVGKKFHENILKAIDICNSVQTEYKVNCFNGLVYYLKNNFEQEKYINTCNLLSEELQDVCINGNY